MKIRPKTLHGADYVPGENWNTLPKDASWGSVKATTTIEGRKGLRISSVSGPNEGFICNLPLSLAINFEIVELAPEEDPTDGFGDGDEKVTPDPGLLTDIEKDALQQLALFSATIKNVLLDGPSKAHDWAEIVADVHHLQQAVLSQAAARAYPNEYRLLGGDFT